MSTCSSAKARGVILTPAGRQYLPYISEALSMIATGTLRLPSRRFEDRLSISSTSLFAYKVLLPRLHKFRELYPNMVVTVEASRQIVQLPSDQFDLAIRNSREPWPKLSCDLLGRIRFVPVGSPRYIADLSRGGPLDWSRATLIHTAAASEDWETWCNHSQTDTSSARKFVVSSAQLALEAAADGLGLAIGRLPIIDDDIVAGRLAIAVDHVVPVMSGYWLVKPPAWKLAAKSLPSATGCSRKCRSCGGTAIAKDALPRSRRRAARLRGLQQARPPPPRRPTRCRPPRNLPLPCGRRRRDSGPVQASGRKAIPKGLPGRRKLSSRQR